MNANELAVYMEDITDFEGSPYRQAATMLRQQQAEIEALKQIIDANNLNQNIGQFVKPTNEPVAWMYEKPNGASKLSFVKELDEQFEKGFKAGKEEGWKAHKFHHPVKELTDEEIRTIQAICHLKNVGYDNFIMRFARAILRKAQEK
jgi:hypothetical protein